MSATGNLENGPRVLELLSVVAPVYNEEALIDEFYARVVAEGADVLKPPTDELWGRREMALRSPDGLRFMLGESI